MPGGVRGGGSGPGMGQGQCIMLICKYLVFIVMKLYIYTFLPLHGYIIYVTRIIFILLLVDMPTGMPGPCMGSWCCMYWTMTLCQNVYS